MCLQMLTQPSQCYLVLLIATAGLTFKAKEPLPLQGSREATKLSPAQPPSTPALGASQEPAALVTLYMLDLGILYFLHACMLKNLASICKQLQVQCPCARQHSALLGMAAKLQCSCLEKSLE